MDFIHTKQYTSYGTFTTNFVEIRHRKLKETMKPSHTLAECVRQVIAFQNDKVSLTGSKHEADAQTAVTDWWKWQSQDCDEKCFDSAWFWESLQRVGCCAKDFWRCHCRRWWWWHCLHQRAQWYGAPHLSGWESAEVQLCLHQAELPCWHIFMALSAWWGTLFREKMATGSPSPASKFGICQAGSSDEMDQTDTRTHPWEAKYTELLCILKGLADFCCNMGEEQYRGCFRLLQNLKFWSAGRSVVLVVSIF